MDARPILNVCISPKTRSRALTGLVGKSGRFRNRDAKGARQDDTAFARVSADLRSGSCISTRRCHRRGSPRSGRASATAPRNRARLPTSPSPSRPGTRDGCRSGRLSSGPLHPARRRSAGPGGPATAFSSAAACGRLCQGSSREHPGSKYSATITPRPAITVSAASRGHAAELAGSWWSTVDVRR